MARAELLLKLCKERADTVVFVLFSLYNKYWQLLEAKGHVPSGQQPQEESAIWHEEKD